MKKKVLIAIAGVLAAGLLIAGGVWMFHIFKNTAGGDKAEKIGEITAFETLTLRESGMRVTQEYAAVAKGEKVEITLYRMHYASGKEEKRPEKSGVCTLEAFMHMLNTCKVGSWNGFHGEHPKYVTDGTMFILEASVNGGKRIFADGSQNFPKHYREFVEFLGENLDK